MISYKNLYSLGLAPGESLGIVNQFRRVAREGFNVTDSPDQRFFKLLFYFYNDDEADSINVDFFNGGSSGLLSPTWLENPTGDYYKYNSAWAYLKNNFEEERANALKNFIILLSRISSESPWYFKEITGVDEAMTRENWIVPTERKKISIKCMADPVDRRIESLISLYRSIVWSQTRKCEVLPANLRKFDMGLFVFSGLINGVTYTKDPSKSPLASINEIKVADLLKRGGTTENINWMEIDSDVDITHNAPYKYLEFHNCEISLDSIKSGYGSLTNESGFEQEFTIDIYFDECYENEYNPYLTEFFGDFFTWDMWRTSIGNDGEFAGNIPEFSFSESGDDSGSTSTETPEMGLWDSYKADLFERANNIKNQAISTVNGMINSTKSSVSNALTGGLGNIYGKGGGIEGAMGSVQQEVSQQIKSLSAKVSGNINETAIKASKSVAGAITAPILGSIKTTGNLVADAVDTAQNIVVKPVLGTLNATKTAISRTTETVASYINEAGDYVANESKRLGDIAYTSQENLANKIGKNRLNSSKLGSIN